MANKKVFTDESLATFVDEIKSYTDGAVSTKANSSHTHSISNITNLQATLDDKADSGHTHSYAGSSSAGGAATSANKVNKTLTVQLNGGTTEGTNKFTFDGSAAKSMNITASSVGAAASGHTHDDKYYTEAEIDTKLSGKADSSHGTHVSYGTSATAVGTTASAGSATTVSRSDHTHSLSKSAVTTALGYTPPTTNTTYSNFVKSGSGAAAGLVPAPSTTAGTTKYLREDGTWQVPPDTKTTVDSSLSSTSTNPVQNKVINTALAGKLSTTGTAAKATADASGNTITSTYMTKSNPVGTGSFSLNRKADTTIGSYSFAGGKDTTASAPYSHAEGLETTASGNQGSHAEGYGTTASGQSTHAEGLNTTASGHYSHAEGWGTIASGYSQHVQGEFNIEQAGTVYAHIVGNGTADARSNAHTLDWDGNAWFAGTIKIGGTGQDDTSATEVATKAYVDELIGGIVNGSY